jgi:hypothetical protein
MKSRPTVKITFPIHWLFLASIILGGLKIAAIDPFVSWSWWLIGLPVLIPLAFYVIFIVFMFVFAVFAMLYAAYVATKLR